MAERLHVACEARTLYWFGVTGLPAQSPLWTYGTASVQGRPARMRAGRLTASGLRYGRACPEPRAPAIKVKFCSVNRIHTGPTALDAAGVAHESGPPCLGRHDPRNRGPELRPRR